MQSRQSANLMALPWNRFHSGGIAERKAAKQVEEKKAKFSLAFFWLTTFYLVYCARPSDLIPGFGAIHPAKITGGLAVLSLFFSIRTSVRKPRDIPKEGFYLILLIILLFASALLSPVWRGGAFDIVLDFSKVVFAWVSTFLLVTSLGALRRIIFIQSASVALISLAAMVKGRSVPRLNGVMGGVYSNPNDLAFAIALCIPFCLAFLLTARSLLRKGAWLLAIIVMIATLLLTASRAGLIDLAISGMVLLWHFGLKGKRAYLIVGAIVLVLGSWIVAGQQLAVRWAGFFGSGQTQEQDTAHESYVQRRAGASKAIVTIAEYPILGIGSGNFVVYSRTWHDVHVSYLEIAVDGGIPALILYVMFFSRAFVNLRLLGKARDLDAETVLFTGAIKSSLVGFVVGACFAPVAYVFFPYFFVCFTSVLAAMVQERERSQGLVGKVVGTSMRSRKGLLSQGKFNGLIHTR